MTKAYGLDCGTMFFQVAAMEGSTVEVKTTRNAFVELADSDDIEDVLLQNKWQYVKDAGQYYVIGEDSLRVAKMFPGKVELRRPLQDGVLNKGEDKKILVLNELIEKAIGKAPDEQSVVCTCISSESVDGSVDSIFHRDRLQGMIKRLGWNVKVIEEALAVILSEKPTIIEEGQEVPFSGIGISCGAGRTNCVLAYKGMKMVGMSAARCGDWIDKQVAAVTDVPLAQVTYKKEKYLDFDNLNLEDDVILALDTYYSAMIEYVFNKFAERFAEVKSRFEESQLDVVVAGGSATPKGFAKKLEKVVRGLKLPFQIKDVKLASDPRNAVVKGCLAQAIVTQKKLQKGKASEDPNLKDILGD